MNFWKLGCIVAGAFGTIMTIAYMQADKEKSELYLSNKLYEVSTGLQQIVIDSQNKIIKDIPTEKETQEELEAA